MNIDRLLQDLKNIRQNYSGDPAVLSDVWVGVSERLLASADGKSPRSFLRWPEICSTMHMPNAAMFCDWYTWLLNNTENWHEKWSKGIKETNIGNPIPFSLDRNSSPTLIQHNYHIAVYEKSFNRSITDADAVVEIGGGYGSMCRLFHNLGFTGGYTIFDLPAMTVLQSLYLKDLGLDVASDGGDAPVRCLHDEDVFFSAMAALPRSARKVLIATWSLSEMPFQQRNKLLAGIKDIQFDHIIFAYQTKHCDIDNIDYFKALPELFGQGYHWKVGDIVELPGSRYLLGCRG